MTETIKVSESLELHAVAESHVTPLYQLICKNKTWLQQSLNWPQFVQSEEDTRKTVQGNVMLHQRGYAKMFMIFKEDELIGVISFNREPLNKPLKSATGWTNLSGAGDHFSGAAALIHHYAQSGELRRFVIKCRVDNPQSNRSLWQWFYP
ncbi:MAG: 50S ribosomal protein L7/L12-serine acetyltransferase [Escherichia coli]